jgi:hypothetical protein
VAQLNLTTGDCLADKGKIGTNTAGFGLSIKEGTNAKMGTATLNGITDVVINNTSVTATSRIMMTIQSSSGTNVGSPYVRTRTAGTSFTIRSTTASDTSVVAYTIIEPS